MIQTKRCGDGFLTCVCVYLSLYSLCLVCVIFGIPFLYRFVCLFFHLFALCCLQELRIPYTWVNKCNSVMKHILFIKCMLVSHLDNKHNFN